MYMKLSMLDARVSSNDDAGKHKWLRSDAWHADEGPGGAKIPEKGNAPLRSRETPTKNVVTKHNVRRDFTP